MDEYAWLAGLLEGEGSFMKGRPSSPGKPIVKVHMTDRDVIQRVADILGVRSFHVIKPKMKHWRPSYYVQVSGQRAVDLMTRIRPMMGERRQGQIDAAVACWNPPWERNRERDQEVLRLYGQLRSYAEVGRRTGLGRQLVRGIVRRNKARSDSSVGRAAA